MTTSVTFTFATRRSPLALAQSREVVRHLSRLYPHVRFVEHQVVTTGDRIHDRPLRDVGGKGLFIKEIEAALLDGTAQFAVHSMKDVPAELCPDLEITCVPERLDPRDALLSRSGLGLLQLPPNTVIGTCSLRRELMLRRANPAVCFTSLRGNVDTRIAKMRDGHIDATVLACAGLIRLGRTSEITEPLPIEVCLPAIGQGALAIECHTEDNETKQLLAPLHHEPTAIAIATERGVMLAAEGSCQVPIAAYAYRTNENELHLQAMLATVDSCRVTFDELRTHWPKTQSQAASIGEELGNKMREKLR